MDEGFSKFLYDAAGEPVPQVDPDEVKVVWEWQRKMEREHPGQLVAVAGGGNITEPTANVRAVGYRATMLLMLRNIAPEILDPLIQVKLEAVPLTIAQIPMEWIGTEGRKGLPFNFEDFISRVNEA
jgi:hypothetical protein